MKQAFRRGDTLIEVLFAITVFSLIVVTSLSLMNQGTAASQRSMEITLVRQQIDSQAETLRFLHDSYVSAYQSGQAPSTGPAGEFTKIINQVKTTGNASASTFGSVKCGTPPSGSFVLDTHAAKLVTNSAIFKYPDTYAQTIYDATGNMTSSNGIWIEGVRSASTGANAGYIDFHIRGCWDTPGLNVSMNLGTIVRLYEPRG
ncbi:MAG TPA: hypothetical protein VN081_06185 [Dongiaceae bacterium]|nr:hypothetical protein [Dongiaceae bacterium]